MKNTQYCLLDTVACACISSCSGSWDNHQYSQESRATQSSPSKGAQSPICRNCCILEFLSQQKSKYSFHVHTKHSVGAESTLEISIHFKRIQILPSMFSNYKRTEPEILKQIRKPRHFQIIHRSRNLREISLFNWI